MNQKDFCDLDIAGAAASITAGDLSVLELTRSCLDRIEALEDTIHAWIHIDSAGAVKTAQQLDLELHQGNTRGILHGIPVGIKDIFHVSGQPTKAGSKFLNLNPSYDATTIARLKQAGAIILGKTHTTEFAYFHPSITRNPWNYDHTPGGSSSGSAAAVASGMCLAALGTQTLGSILRPAAFNGIVGLKPQYGRISTHGVIPLSWSLDHVGILTRKVEDAAIILSVIAGHDPNDQLSLLESVPQYTQLKRNEVKPVIGFVKEFFFDHADQEMQDHTLRVLENFRNAGVQVQDINFDFEFSDLVDTGSTIMGVEAAAYHLDMYQQNGESYGDETKALIERGLHCSATDYANSIQSLFRYRRKALQLLKGVDVLLTAGATGAAPSGLASTGNPVIHAPWTILGMPSISLPTGLNEKGLPLAIQMVGSPFAEDGLLANARWCEKLIGFSSRPGGI